MKNTETCDHEAVRDPISGESVCSKCGVVLSELLVMNGNMMNSWEHDEYNENSEEQSRRARETLKARHDLQIAIRRQEGLLSKMIVLDAEYRTVGERTIGDMEVEMEIGRIKQKIADLGEQLQELETEEDEDEEDEWRDYYVDGKM